MINLRITTTKFVLLPYVRVRVSHLRIVSISDYYYNNTNSAGDLFTSSDLPSGVIRHNDLADFTNNRPFFSVGEWGIIKEDGNAYNDYPIPVVCGGVSTAYTGDGQSESTAYIIKTEADLNKLKESVNKSLSRVISTATAMPS